MATAATENPHEVTATWAANGGPTDDEKAQFAEEVLRQLSGDDMGELFLENIKAHGVQVIQSDDAFGRVWHRFADMALRYRQDFPDLIAYNAEWIGYKARWASHLSLSRDATNEHISLFKRIDKVYLDIGNIQTDQDRQNVIAELQQLIEEKNDTSEEMPKGSLVLRRDIYDFEYRLDRFVEGIESQPDSRGLRDAIDNLQSGISNLDEKIKAAAIALGVTGFLVIPAIVAGPVLAAFQVERTGKTNELVERQKQLADVNRKQGALANLKADLVGVKADIEIINPTVTSNFAEIPSMARAQNQQFQEHLKGGMGGVGNTRFKREVQIAKKMCAALQAGLVWYAQELKNRT